MICLTDNLQQSTDDGQQATAVAATSSDRQQPVNDVGLDDDDAMGALAARINLKKSRETETV